MEDEFESLRQKSARTSSIYDELEEGEETSSGGNFLSGFTPQQRLILAVLLLVDVIAVGIGLLVLTGRISF